MDRAERQERAREPPDKRWVWTVGAITTPSSSAAACSNGWGWARALALDPEVLFFDEPFSALDPLIRRDMQDEFLSLQERLQRTLIFITHRLRRGPEAGGPASPSCATACSCRWAPRRRFSPNRRTTTSAPSPSDAPIAKVTACLLPDAPAGRRPRRTPPEGAESPRWRPLEKALPAVLLASPNPLVVCDADDDPVGLLYGEDVAEGGVGEQPVTRCRHAGRTRRRLCRRAVHERRAGPGAEPPRPSAPA